MSVIILSYTKNLDYYNMLKNCINSIGTDCDIIVVETNKKLKDKKINLPCRFIFPEEEFNYNRFLNIGFENLKEKDKVIISNNDVIYEPGCIKKLYKELDNYDSVSPAEKLQYTQVGNKVGIHVKGWCIGLKYKVYEAMGKWDENFKFWYQDNDYCNFLEKNNLTHALIGDARAKHLVSKSHELVGNLKEFTHDQLEIFESKWK